MEITDLGISKSPRIKPITRSLFLICDSSGGALHNYSSYNSPSPEIITLWGPHTGNRHRPGDASERFHCLLWSRNGGIFHNYVFLDTFSKKTNIKNGRPKIITFQIFVPIWIFSPVYFYVMLSASLNLTLAKETQYNKTPDNHVKPSRSFLKVHHVSLL